MKKFLHWLVDLLDRKFPDKVVVTDASYRELIDIVKKQNELMIEMEKKIIALEHNLLNVNQAMGMTIPKMGMLER